MADTRASSRRVVDVGPGLAARAHLALLRVALAPLRAIGGRGGGRVVRLLSRPFPHEDYVAVARGPVVVEIGLGDAYWAPYLLTDRRYEADVERVLERLLRSDCAFIDCGANVGWWSAYAGARVPRGRVVAVEPSAALHERLTTNAARNTGAFTCVRAAVWRSGGTLTLATDPTRHAWGSVAPTVREGLLGVGFVAEEVPAVTVDDLVLTHTDGTQRVTIVKLDVEGAELDALQGATQTIASGGIFLFEEHGRDRECAAASWLLDRGLDLFLCQPDHVVRVADRHELDRLRTDPSRGYNVLAVTPGTDGHRRVEALLSA